MEVVPNTGQLAMKPERFGTDFWAALVRSSADGISVLDSDCRVVYANPATCEMLGYRLDQLLARHRLTFQPEQERQTYRKFLDGARGGRSEPRTAIAYRPDGSRVEAELTATVLSLQGRQFFVIAARDVTERNQRARQAAALAQAAASVAESGSIQATLQAIAQCALGGTRALAAWLTLDSEDEVAAWVGAAGVPDGFHDRIRPAAGARAACGGFTRALMTQRVVVYADARRKVESEPGTACVASVLRLLPWQPAAFAPLLYESGVVGVLTAVYPKDELPYAAETTFLGALAHQATMAAANARLVAAAREKAALEERQRLAKELHDSVSQSLFGIHLGARMAREWLDQDRDQAAKPIDYVIRLAEDCQAEMSARIFALRPDLLETEGLVTALNKQLEPLRTRHGITAPSLVSDEPDLPIDVKRALHRIAQEAIDNTVRHARARRLDVHLEGNGGSQLLEIGDDGVGFDPEQSLPTRPGLRSMRERALEVGGSFEVISSQDRGTRIVVSVPTARRTLPAETALLHPPRAARTGTG